MKHGRILQRDAGHLDALAIGEFDQIGPVRDAAIGVVMEFYGL